MFLLTSKRSASIYFNLSLTYKAIKYFIMKTNKKNHICFIKYYGYKY